MPRFIDTRLFPMGAILGMNGHERLAAEGELMRMDEKLFLDTQRLAILQSVRESLEKIKPTLANVVDPGHALRQLTVGAHNSSVLECGLLSASIARLKISIKQVQHELSEDDALMMSTSAA